MNLVTLIIFGSGVFVGWTAHLNKESLKKWVRSRLKSANEKAKNL